MASHDSTAVVVAPTSLESVMARLVVRRYPVIRSGIAGLRHVEAQTIVVSGLAGGLGNLESGSIVVAEYVGSETEDALPCDGQLVKAMVSAGHQLGITVTPVALLTSQTLITGDDRSIWAARGFAAVDMETFLWRRRHERITAVRAILDTPTCPISDAWLQSSRAIPRPELWRELAWLVKRAPIFALRAARVVALGLDMASRR